MGDSYTEQLVKQKTTMATTLKKIALILGVVICILVAMLVPVLVILPAIGIMVVYFFWKRLSSLEFEYIYYNGDLDIDRIMGMEARKRVFSTNAKEMEVLAPTGSIELQPYQNLKVLDYSTNTGNPTYELVAKVKEQNVRVIFEPNDTILDGMRMYAPRKVFLRK